MLGTLFVRQALLSVPDEIKVGQPYEVTAEVWSTEKTTRRPFSRVTLRTSSLRTGGGEGGGAGAD